jgi:DNA-binding ferritin-like protein (Dps family)
MKELLENNKYYTLSVITDNYLFCLEQINDHNADYFIYQKEKIVKKNGKSYKNKLSKVGNRTLLKRVLKDSDSNFTSKIFKTILELFELLTLKDENNTLVFNNDYITYVKDNFNENKNFSKMIMVFDNVENILNSKINEDELVDELEDNLQLDTVKETSKPGKKNKKNKSNGKLGNDFMKGLENTKIAQLAKNISEKININDFPALSDPSKLLSSLGNPGEEGGIQNLLKFVVGEVEEAFKSDGINEKDLVNEAQNIMGQFQNMSGFDPMSILKNGNGDGLDMDKFADIFSKMGK